MPKPFHIAFDPVPCFRAGWEAVMQYGTLPLILGGLLHACTTPSLDLSAEKDLGASEGFSFNFGSLPEIPLDAIRPVEPPHALVQNFMNELTILLVIGALVGAAVMLLINSWLAVHPPAGRNAPNKAGEVLYLVQRFRCLCPDAHLATATLRHSNRSGSGELCPFRDLFWWGLAA